MEIILNDELVQRESELKNLRQYLTELILEKDELLCHICPNLEADYINKIGAYEQRVSELDTEVRELKRKLELIRAKLNRREKVDLAEIERQIEEEYREFEAKLIESEKLLFDSSKYLDSMSLTDSESARLKNAYRMITKQLHPDINPDTTDEEKTLFLRAVEAYKSLNIKELEIIAALVEKAPEKDEDNADEKTARLCEQLQKGINSVKADIDSIKMGFPYRYKDFLDDEDKVRQRQSELNKAYNELKEAEQSYKEAIEKALKSAGM